MSLRLVVIYNCFHGVMFYETKMETVNEIRLTKLSIAPACQRCQLASDILVALPPPGQTHGADVLLKPIDNK